MKNLKKSISPEIFYNKIKKIKDVDLLIQKMLRGTKNINAKNFSLTSKDNICKELDYLSYHNIWELKKINKKQFIVEIFLNDEFNVLSSTSSFFNVKKEFVLSVDTDREVFVCSKDDENKVALITISRNDDYDFFVVE